MHQRSADRPPDDRYDPAVLGGLVAAAAGGDESAWNDLVERFAPLLAGVLSTYRLAPAARQDVAQVVWLRLVENLDRIRDPRAVPKWLVTTARREALHQLGQNRRALATDPVVLVARVTGPPLPSAPDLPDPDAGLLARERHQALLAALAELPDQQRRLVVLLLADPPLGYAEIARRLAVPVGSIGPTRQRALARLRRSAALQGLAEDEDGPGPGAVRPPHRVPQVDLTHAATPGGTLGPARGRTSSWGVHDG